MIKARFKVLGLILTHKPICPYLTTPCIVLHFLASDNLRKHRVVMPGAGLLSTELSGPCRPQELRTRRSTPVSDGKVRGMRSRR